MFRSGVHLPLIDQKDMLASSLVLPEGSVEDSYCVFRATITMPASATELVIRGAVVHHNQVLVERGDIVENHEHVQLDPRT